MDQNRRSHLALISEAFLNALIYRPPHIYKPSAGANAIDQTFVIETISQLSNSLAKFVRGPVSEVTPAENIYYNTVGLLSTLVPLCSSSDRTGLAPETLTHMTDAVKSAIESLQARVDENIGDDFANVLHRLHSFHDLTMFHDAATATSLVAQWILTFNDREKERDRSGKSNLPKEVVAQMKTLQTVAEAALKHGKAFVATLKDDVSRETLRRGFAAGCLTRTVMSWAGSWRTGRLRIWLGVGD